MKQSLLSFPLVLVNPVKGWNDRIVKINVCMFHCFESGQFIRMRLSEGGSIILCSVTFQDRENMVPKLCTFMFMYIPCIFIVHYLCVSTYSYIYIYITIFNFATNSPTCFGVSASSSVGRCMAKSVL